MANDKQTGGHKIGDVKYLSAAIKSVEERDDGLYVEGCLAAEEIDGTNEVMDWETSLPHFKSWNAYFAEKTANAEGGVSVGNLRVMHQSRGPVAGKFVSMTYDDVAKKVLVTAKVTNEIEKKNVREGIYTAFSVGAKYLKKWYDAGLKAVRWTAGPFEGSLVDYGAIPSANGFTYRSLDGQEETVAFDGGRRELRKALESIGSTPTMAEEDRAVSAIHKMAAARKGLYGVSAFAQLMSQLVSLRDSLKYERENEGDDSPVTDRVSEATNELLECLAAYTQEEISEEITNAKSKEAAMADLVDIKKKRDQLKTELDAAEAAFKAAGGKDEVAEKCAKSEGDCTDESCKAHGDAVKKRASKKEADKSAGGGDGEVALKRADVVELVKSTVGEELKSVNETLVIMAEALKAIGSAPAASNVNTRGFVVSKDDDDKTKEAKKSAGDLAGEGKTRDAIHLTRQNPTFIAGAR